MRIAFIVTSYNIESYIGPCLDSLAPCVDPGDEVIVVDDGSTDATPEILAAFAAAGGYGTLVPLRLVLLGVNTPGGVGIPGNIGLNEALRDDGPCRAVFFVDGDDWLLAPGFRAARARFEAGEPEAAPDILIANYLEYDEKAGASRAPADQARWAGVAAAQADGPAALRQLALSMIAVPWRKFYRRDFLARQGLRFPQGNFFYEDNPFHWAVCLAADRIGFADRILCQHRINRPGQTMAATGAELTAFFTHFATISAHLDTPRPPIPDPAADPGPTAPGPTAPGPAAFTTTAPVTTTPGPAASRSGPAQAHPTHPAAPLPTPARPTPAPAGHDPRSAERLAAVEWLLGNMAWHLDRLRPQAQWDYVRAAGPALRSIPDPLWARAMAGRFAATAVARTADQLRCLDPGTALALWQGERSTSQSDAAHRKLDALGRDLKFLRTDIATLRTDLATLRTALTTVQTQTRSLHSIAEFEALRALLTPYADHPDILQTSDQTPHPSDLTEDPDAA